MYTDEFIKNVIKKSINIDLIVDEVFFNLKGWCLTEYVNSKYLDDPVSILELTVRPSNALANANIKTIRELVGFSEKDLGKIKNLGKGSITEITECLAKIELSLNMDLGG